MRSYLYLLVKIPDQKSNAVSSLDLIFLLESFFFFLSGREMRCERNRRNFRGKEGEEDERGYANEPRRSRLCRLRMLLRRPPLMPRSAAWRVAMSPTGGRSPAPPLSISPLAPPEDDREALASPINAVI